jgi:hypothetical protein
MKRFIEREQQQQQQAAAQQHAGERREGESRSVHFPAPNISDFRFSGVCVVVIAHFKTNNT